MIRKQEKKTEKGKIPPDIILKAARAVKIHNLSNHNLSDKPH